MTCGTRSCWNESSGEYEIETVMHLAAQTIVGIAYVLQSTFESNIGWTWSLLEACRRKPPPVKHVVVASSDKAYGEHDSLPVPRRTHRYRAAIPTM